MPGPIQIKRQDVTDDIRALAHLTGLSITDTIQHAVQSQLAIERVKANKDLSKRRAQAEKELAEIWNLPVVGPILTDDDLYDADGLPK